jgi:alginate O-acetyltransferase complex protein AlgI
MSFHSFSFVFMVLPIAVTGYFLTARIAGGSWPKLWLIAVSFVFVSAGRIQDVPILLASLVFNCVIASRLVRKCGVFRLSHRGLLIAGIVVNVGFLGYFKYAAFFVGAFNQLAHTALPMPSTAFPLGISFYTIYQVMFLVDCYEGLVEGHNWLDHFTFASLFPYVTMGPIVRWKQVVPQLNAPNSRLSDTDNIAMGLFVFLLGFFKKVVLADTFVRWADAGFSYGHPLSFVGGWIAALAFTFQLYFDFSGYTDMALGAALMLNLTLPQNFDAPFRAQSIIDFWRRWHMTLTNFITTYLYTPMMRSWRRVTFAKAMLATFLAMLIAGFWHGANWTFLCFGALHGAALVVNQCWRKLKWAIPSPLAWLSTFVFVVASLVFFRSGSVTQALQILGSMFTPHAGWLSYAPWASIEQTDQIVGLGWMLGAVVVVFRAPSSLALQRSFKPSWSRVAFAVGLAVVACIYANGIVSRSFVYREF